MKLCVENELGGSNVDELHAVESEEVTRVMSTGVQAYIICLFSRRLQAQT
jgi:hypothetical protein